MRLPGDEFRLLEKKAPRQGGSDDAGRRRRRMLSKS